MANKKVEKTEKHHNIKGVEEETTDTSKLDGIQTMHKFIKELQAIKDGDYSKVIPFTQITWRETSKNITDVLKMTAERLTGSISVRIKKKLSDNCFILELRTNTGIYSSKVICEKEAYKPDTKGEWGVNPLSFYKM